MSTSSSSSTWWSAAAAAAFPIILVHKPVVIVHLISQLSTPNHLAHHSLRPLLLQLRLLLMLLRCNKCSCCCGLEGEAGVAVIATAVPAAAWIILNAQACQPSCHCLSVSMILQCTMSYCCCWCCCLCGVRSIIHA
jgi:hypothetical protein